MKTTLTEQQTAFYTKNGFIEFEIPHDFPVDQSGRDQFRQEPKLKEFLLRKLGPLALALTGRKQLRLACDQLITKENRPKKIGLIKEIFSIQGFAIGVAISDNPVFPEKKSTLGIMPLPTKSANILFFRPEILLDWPHVLSDVYIALFALPNAVYIHNPNDPDTNYLKKLGYSFGDQLKNEQHPQIL
ncbi:MAG: hypothetical protein COT85_05140 [Chlamydiae bacterium CG10_big_fil_rev_8_21_14_0_10_42_34]|nr:MAG: hypothetical protein COT85_05140 [Chlamydiae bacterium CG10_big_fil_rev_8_21_14_0_10_42_34]